MSLGLEEKYRKTANTCRFVSFNICGIKNVLNYNPWREEKTFAYMFKLLQADIICFQETKIQPKDLTENMALVPGFNAFFTFPTVKKGYSGVAMYVRKGIPVVKAEQGLSGYLESSDCKGTCYRDLAPEIAIGGYPNNLDKVNGLEIDSEGRALVVDIGDCVIIGLYCPANSSGDRDAYTSAFFDILDIRITNLVALDRKVVVLGDLNVARELIDSAQGKQDYIKMGLISSLYATQSLATVPARDFLAMNSEAALQWKQTTRGREILGKWIQELQFVDTSRKFYPDRMTMYTCWNQKLDARPGNFGSRIDYILIKGLECKDADILPMLLGSDHCPIYADIVLNISSDANGNDNNQRNNNDDSSNNINNNNSGTNDNNNSSSNNSNSSNSTNTTSIHMDDDKLVAGQSIPKLCACYMSQFGGSHNIKSLFAKKRSMTTIKGIETLPNQSPATVHTSKSGTKEIKKKFLKNDKKLKHSTSVNSALGSSLQPPLSKKQKTLASFFVKNIPDDNKKINNNINYERNDHHGKSEENNSKNNINYENHEFQGSREPQHHETESLTPNTQQNKTNNEWTKLLTPNPPPLCSGHNESCKLMKSKKPGQNFGRQFWVCARYVFS